MDKGGFKKFEERRLLSITGNDIIRYSSNDELYQYKGGFLDSQVPYPDTSSFTLATTKIPPSVKVFKRKTT